jgi:hypothetical protein
MAFGERSIKRKKFQKESHPQFKQATVSRGCLEDLIRPFLSVATGNKVVLELPEIIKVKVVKKKGNGE